jgi:hypothetical protein
VPDDHQPAGGTGKYAGITGHGRCQLSILARRPAITRGRAQPHPDLGYSISIGCSGIAQALPNKCGFGIVGDDIRWPASRNRGDQPAART